MTQEKPPLSAQESTEPLASSKSIVLFSDGTGNSSAKLFKTNVWRMYEAVDLGPPAPDRRCQISYYDDGVGTSTFKPLALLGGGFGWGLKRNVLDIYRFACRNYRAGDDIYGFGFSRGAFTMRVAIAFIASQGLVLSDNEEELLRRSADAYRAFRKEMIPRKFQLPTRAWRRIRDAWRENIGPQYDQKMNRKPRIKFVGVWDTVAAYGGPFVEITRAIDDWIYALSMPNYQLNDKVDFARHALALDDERDAFQPLLWDEVHENKLIADGTVTEDRLQQVWFTGMHSDVGGGYPDESLSFVSLLWMMEEAEKAGLRTLDAIKARFTALASSAGPIHDSRRGLAAYYRYQPRKIITWMDPVHPTTLSQRDPLITDGHGRPQGLLREVRVHESVIARIATGTDRYAPLALPEQFTVFPPQAHGENVPQPDSGGSDPQVPTSASPLHLISDELRKHLRKPEVLAARIASLESVWDLVWRRRVTYFVTVILTALLLSLPLWLVPPFPESPSWIGVILVGGLTRLMSVVLPNFFAPWLNAYAENAAYFLAFSLAIFLAMKHSASLELRLRDQARKIWRDAVSPGVTPTVGAPSPTIIQNFRNSCCYQQIVKTIKWRLLPFGALITAMAVGLWLIVSATTQVPLPILESAEMFCKSTDAVIPNLTIAKVPFYTSSTCNSVGHRVVRGHDYEVAFEVRQQWVDNSYATSPEGLEARKIRFGIGYAGVLLRRVVKAKYLQPIVEIRQPKGSLGLSSVYLTPLVLEQQNDSGNIYRGRFRAERDGELFIFANDATSPFNPTYFYRTMDKQKINRGSACVTLQDARVTVIPGMRILDSCPNMDATAGDLESPQAPSMPNSTGRPSQK